MVSAKALADTTAGRRTEATQSGANGVTQMGSRKWGQVLLNTQMGSSI